MKEMVIRAQHAFDAPDVLTMFVGEMRQQAEQLQATAAVLVAPKSAVSFPQVGVEVLRPTTAAPILRLCLCIWQTVHSNAQS